MAYTYWRLNVTATQAGDTYVTAAEIEMRTSVGGSNACTGGTATSKDNFAGLVASNALDGNASTRHIANGSSGFPKWWQYQFASPVDIVEVVWKGGDSSDGSNRSRNPYVIELQRSNDGSTFTTVCTWYTDIWTDAQAKVFRVPTGTDPMHYRVRVTDTTDHTYAECAEIEIRGTVGGTDLATTAQLHASTNFAHGSNAANANDASNSTIWRSASGLGSLGFQLAAPLDYLAEIKWRTTNGSDGIARGPRSFVVESRVADMDHTASWTTVWTESSIGTWTAGEQKTFTNPNPAPGSGVSGSATALFGITAGAAGESDIHATATALLGIRTIASSHAPIEAIATALLGITANASSAAEVEGIATANFGIWVDGFGGEPFDWVAIDDTNQVIDVGYGLLPTTTPTTYYKNVTGFTPLPEVGWYFDQTCGVFSDTQFPIAPGNVAPPGPFPGTPGGQPIPGGPGWPPGPYNPGPTPLATTVPTLIVFQGNFYDGITIPACPAALTEVDPKLRTAYDLNGVCALRLQCDVETECPNNAAQLVLMFSLDGGSTWAMVSTGLTGPAVSIADPGDQRGLFVNVTPAAQTDVLLSLFVRRGDGSTDVVIGNVGALAYQKVDLGSCLDIVEPSPGGFIEFGITVAATGEVSGGGGPSLIIPDVTPGFGSPIAQDDFSSYTSTSDMRSRLLAGTDAGGIDAGSTWAGGAHDLIVDTVDGQQALRSDDFSNDSDNFKTLGAPVTDLWLRQVRWREAFAGAASAIVAQGPWAIDTTVLTAAWYFYVTTEYLGGNVRHQCGVGGGGSLVETANTHTDESDPSAFNALDVWDQIMHLVDTGSAIECTYFFNGAQVAFMSHSYTTESPAGFNKLLVRPVSVNGVDVTSLLLWEAFDGGDPYGLL